MLFSAQQLPLDELNLRHDKCRQLLQKYMPDAQGLFVFSRSNIYYLTGTRANGMLWLPLDGEPVLLVRKGEDRCRLESPLQNIATFKSYSNIPEICAEFNAALGSCIGAEMRALPWSLAQMLQDRLKSIQFVPANTIFEQARFLKTDYELSLLRAANDLHMQALQEQVLGLETFAEDSKVLLEQVGKSLCAGMTEREIAHNLWHRFFALGHGGMLRLHGHGQEMFLGKIAAGLSALYPSPFKGSVGLMGEHPAIPFMGYAGNVWNENELLIMDTAFMHQGYHSAIAMTYWSGSEESLPSLAQKAYDCCLEILDAMLKNLQGGQDAKSCWQMACSIAKQQGFDEGFMGFGKNKSLAHGLGLELDEGVIIGENIDENLRLESNAVLNIGPMIALPNLGMVGLKHSFVVTSQGELQPFSGLDIKQNIEFIEEDTAASLLGL